MRKFYTLLFFCICLSPLFAQQFSFHKEIKFVKYLQDKEQFNEATWVLKNIDSSKLSLTQKDSLYFELGWDAYTHKRLDTSILFLSKVSKQDYRFLKSSFFAAYNSAYLKKYKQSDSLLSAIDTIDSSHIELKKFELAGLALLQKDYVSYNRYQSAFTFSSYILKKEETNFNSYYHQMVNFKKRSPIIAGLLSAVIPGSGKFYAGKKKQAIGALLPILSAAFLTLEAYNKDGLNSARFWIYGSAFSVFYIGNIWGSVVSVKIKNQEIERTYENKILFDMHIPLRNFFN